MIVAHSNVTIYVIVPPSHVAPLRTCVSFDLQDQYSLENPGSLT